MNQIGWDYKEKKENIFSDKNKFDLDGCEDWVYYLFDIRDKTQTIFKQH